MSNPASIATRKTRFVCLSDTHNYALEDVPDGDVLIHCGDLTNLGSYRELCEQVKWLESLPHNCKVVIAGNHDLALDAEFYPTTWMSVLWPSNVQACRKLFKESSHLMYLEHESRTIKLDSPGSPHTTFTIFGSPYTPISGRKWAFQYNPHYVDDGVAADQLWSAIPLETDIVVTHGPAFGHLDTCDDGGMAGCEALKWRLWSVRPKMHLCGHIHEARGVERVSWNLEPERRPSQMVLGVKQWKDGVSERTFDGSPLLDLTKTGGSSLRNDGALPGLEDDGDSQRLSADRPGRKETCFVNCAVKTGRWPSLPLSQPKPNRPMVFDLDLPVW